jgi:hypothetical protein
MIPLILNSTPNCVPKTFRCQKAFHANDLCFVCVSKYRRHSKSHESGELCLCVCIHYSFLADSISPPVRSTRRLLSICKTNCFQGDNSLVEGDVTRGPNYQIDADSSQVIPAAQTILCKSPSVQPSVAQCQVVQRSSRVIPTMLEICFNYRIKLDPGCWWLLAQTTVTLHCVRCQKLST